MGSSFPPTVEHVDFTSSSMSMLNRPSAINSNVSQFDANVLPVTSTYSNPSSIKTFGYGVSGDVVGSGGYPQQQFGMDMDISRSMCTVYKILSR